MISIKEPTPGSAFPNKMFPNATNFPPIELLEIQLFLSLGKDTHQVHWDRVNLVADLLHLKCTIIVKVQPASSK